jgi:hypothetical protein
VPKLKANQTTFVAISLLAIGLTAGALYLRALRRPDPSAEPFRPKAEKVEEKQPLAATNPAGPTVNDPASPPPSTKTEEGEALVVDTPSNGSQIGQGTVVRGKARVFEGRVAYRVKSRNQGVLSFGSGKVTGDATQLSPFSFELPFEKQPAAGDEGVLELFSYSGSDGSEVNKVVIPVKF